MTQREDGFTLIELLIVVAIISIIAAIAVPGLLQARITANEASAIGSLKTTTAAQTLYSTSCGNGGFAASFAVLGTAPGSGGDAFISADLGGSTTPQKSGYSFTLGGDTGSTAGPNDCNGTATVTAWYATGVPQTVGTSGRRGFAVNAGNTTWQDTTGVAPTTPFTRSATVTPVQQ